MKFCLKSVSLLAGMAIFISCLAVQNINSADNNIKNTNNAGEKQIMRDEYVKNFKRIGLNTTPGDANLLRILIEAANCKRGIEVGTATGYGAILMGMAFEKNNGELITIDIDPKMVEAANENIQNMDLQDTVKVIESDALKAIPELQGEFDFLFIDALKEDYFKYFKAAEPMLKPGSLIVADNVIRFKDAMQDFLSFMEESPDYHIQIITASEEKGDGMAIIYKVK